jgi:putative ABC transport system permease protein
MTGWLRTLSSRIRSLFSRRASDEDFTRELDSHLAMLTEENIRRGMAPGEARRLARLRLGGSAQLEETNRELRGLPFLESLAQDVRFALRMLRKSPGFAAVAILTLALGIGSTSAVFSVVDRILFRSPPYPQGERLVSFGLTAPYTSNEFMLGMDYVEWRKLASPFAEMGSMAPGMNEYDLTEHNPVRVTFAEVDSHFLPTLGIQPLLGRNFSSEECRPHGPRVTLLSYGFWRSRYGGDASIVGRSISLNEQPTQIIGVLPVDFEMPTLARADLLLPENLDEAGMRRGGPQPVLRTFARLKPGVTVAQSRVALEPLFDQAMTFVPPSFRNEVHLSVRSLRDLQVGDAKLASWILMVAVLAVLLLASTNVANLLLARALVRQRETALRVALGASTARLVRQALTESMVLSLAGVAAGSWVAYGLLRLFVAIAPEGIPRLQQAALDRRVLLFTLAVAVVSSLLFGLAPAWRRLDPEILCGRDARPISRGPLRKVLVASQIAVSFVLLTGAGLLLGSLWRLESVPIGMDAQNIVTAEVMLAPYRYHSEIEQRTFFEQILARLKQIPGINSVAISSSLPLSGEGDIGYSNIEISGRPRTPQGTGGMVGFHQVTPGYFSTLETKILSGREFTDDDLFPSQNVVVLSDALGRRLFPNGGALGKSMRFGVPGVSAPWRTIVGIAADLRNDGLEHESDPEFYVPWKDDPEEYYGHAFVIMRTPVNFNTVANWVRSEVASIDPAQPVAIEQMTQRVSKMADRPRFNAALLALFALAGLCLAAVGLFGVVGFLVAQRTQEIGVRMALGATRGDILRLVLGSVARWTFAGLLAGVIGSWFAVQILRTLLFQLSVHDPWLFGTSTVLLVMIAFLAAFIPARRAMRVDPMVALRHE